MRAPSTSTIWIAAAGQALAGGDLSVPDERMLEVRESLRDAAIAAGRMVEIAAGPRGATRSRTIAILVERLGDRAADVDLIGATLIEEAVASALADAGVEPAEADRVAAECRIAVLRAGAAVDTLSALVAD